MNKILYSWSKMPQSNAVSNNWGCSITDFSTEKQCSFKMSVLSKKKINSFYWFIRKLFELNLKKKFTILSNNIYAI